MYIIYKGAIKLKRLFNAILIGISYVIPGVCSSTTANSLGEYQNILEVTGNFYRLNVLKKHLILILGIIIGGLLSVIGLSLIVNNYICIILSIFLGLNIALFQFYYVNVNSIIFTLLGIIVVVVLTLNFNISFNNSIIAYIISGLVVGLGFVLPGLSGSLLMLSMGVYQDILFRINLILNGKIHLDLNIILFVIALIVGVVLWSKILFTQLKKHNNSFESFVKGMSISGIALLSHETFAGVKEIWLIILLVGLTILTFIIVFIVKRTRDKRDYERNFSN